VGIKVESDLNFTSKGVFYCKFNLNLFGHNNVLPVKPRKTQVALTQNMYHHQETISKKNLDFFFKDVFFCAKSFLNFDWRILKNEFVTSGIIQEFIRLIFLVVSHFRKNPRHIIQLLMTKVFDDCHVELMSRFCSVNYVNQRTHGRIRTLSHGSKISNCVHFWCVYWNIQNLSFFLCTNNNVQNRKHKYNILQLLCILYLLLFLFLLYANVCGNFLILDTYLRHSLNIL